MSGRIRTSCKGRKRRTCKQAPKSCSYASGTKRRYCRKKRNNRTKKVV